MLHHTSEGAYQPPHRPTYDACHQFGPYEGQMPDEMRLAIRMSQPLMQRLPPPMKQREMQTSSEHTTACAGDTYVALDTISVSAAITSENRRMEHLPLRKD